MSSEEIVKTIVKTISEAVLKWSREAYDYIHNTELRVLCYIYYKASPYGTRCRVERVISCNGIPYRIVYYDTDIMIEHYRNTFVPTTHEHIHEKIETESNIICNVSGVSDVLLSYDLCREVVVYGKIGQSYVLYDYKLFFISEVLDRLCATIRVYIAIPYSIETNVTRYEVMELFSSNIDIDYLKRTGRVSIMFSSDTLFPSLDDTIVYYIKSGKTQPNIYDTLFEYIDMANLEYMLRKVYDVKYDENAVVEAIKHLRNVSLKPVLTLYNELLKRDTILAVFSMI